MAPRQIRLGGPSTDGGVECHTSTRASTRRHGGSRPWSRIGNRSVHSRRRCATPAHDFGAALNRLVGRSSAEPCRSLSRSRRWDQAQLSELARRLGLWREHAEDLSKWIAYRSRRPGQGQGAGARRRATCRRTARPQQRPCGLRRRPITKRCSDGWFLKIRSSPGLMATGMAGSCTSSATSTRSGSSLHVWRLRQRIFSGCPAGTAPRGRSAF